MLVGSVVRVTPLSVWDIDNFYLNEVLTISSIEDGRVFFEGKVSPLLDHQVELITQDNLEVGMWFEYLLSDSSEEYLDRYKLKHLESNEEYGKVATLEVRSCRTERMTPLGNFENWSTKYQDEVVQYVKKIFNGFKGIIYLDNYRVVMK